MGKKKKLFIPPFLLIQETIDKYGYNPEELEGVESHDLLMICTCFTCNNIYSSKYHCILKRYTKGSKCMYCANKERAQKNAQDNSLLLREKVKNGTYIPPMLGKTHTDKTKKQLSDKRSGVTWETILGKEKADLYKKQKSLQFSGDKKKKISINSILTTRRGNKCNFYGKKYWPNRKLLLYNGVYYRSNWEILVVKYFEVNNIKYEYENKVFILDDKETYTPDFYLPETNKWIEVKGYWYEDAKIKFEKFKQIHNEIDIDVWDEKKLIELNIIINKNKWKELK